MDRRYQVFISSTFKDLVDERQAVLKAILELDQMPAGMELFPASDETAWELIEDVIQGSDYYVVLVGGRYGSLDAAGIGYTEREYDYAYKLGRPVIPLLHKEPEKLPRELTETDDDAWKKLLAFRAKLEGQHTCTYWTTALELKAQAIVGLTTAMKRHPAVGWVRSDQVPTGATVAEVLALRDRVVDLESQLAAARLAPPPGTEELAQGEDSVEVDVTFLARAAGTFYGGITYRATLDLTWNEVFAAIAPTMIDEASDLELVRAFARFFEERVRTTFSNHKDFKGKDIAEVKIAGRNREDFVIQFRALGLMRESTRQRSVRDTSTYWTLTPYGDETMTQLRAVRRRPTAPLMGEATAVAEPSTHRRRKPARNSGGPEEGASDPVR